jgi:hypothetical protein
LILYAHLDAARQVVGLSPIYIPSVAAPGEVALLALDGAVDGMQELESQPGWELSVPIYLPEISSKLF